MRTGGMSSIDAVSPPSGDRCLRNARRMRLMCAPRARASGQGRERRRANAWPRRSLRPHGERRTGSRRSHSYTLSKDRSVSASHLTRSCSAERALTTTRVRGSGGAGAFAPPEGRSASAPQ